MKIFIRFFFFILTSCGPEAVKFQRQYVIENSSTVPIEIRFYRSGELAFRFGATQLENGEQLEGQILERSGGPWSDLSDENNERLPTLSFEADSVRLVFNNQKLHVYTEMSSPDGLIFTPSNRNILRDSDYSAIGGDKFLFTITESDFENAEDCDGNCE